MLKHEGILTYNPGGRTWWSRIFVEIPTDVQHRLAIAKHASTIASQLAPLEPEANREILYQVAALLGVLNDRETKP